ncbi:MAG: hypothetical protein KDI90_02375 [Alphaproteobacteria bacterium]|nr:hypothetical protein [Alphaproteobacteria bacterium]MCB9975166.1 hypothetical protein [Rhodospirillales bacterium]
MEHFSRAGRKRLKKYLKKVSRSMKRKGADKEEIEAVVESLREQVIELVGQPEEKAGKDVIEEILGNFDTPQAFGEQVALNPLPKTDSTAWVAQFSARASIAGVFLALILGALVTSAGGNGQHVGGVAFLVCEVMAFITGAIKFRTKPGRIGLVISGLLLLVFVIAVNANK